MPEAHSVQMVCGWRAIASSNSTDRSMLRAGTPLPWRRCRGTTWLKPRSRSPSRRSYLASNTAPSMTPASAASDPLSGGNEPASEEASPMAPPRPPPMKPPSKPLKPAEPLRPPVPLVPPAPGMPPVPGCTMIDPPEPPGRSLGGSMWGFGAHIAVKAQATAMSALGSHFTVRIPSKDFAIASARQ